MVSRDELDKSVGFGSWFNSARLSNMVEQQASYLPHPMLLLGSM